MSTCACGSEWWVEQRELRLAAGPAQDPRMQTQPADYRFRLVCAGCGAAYGAEPPPNPSATTAPPAPAPSPVVEPEARPKPKPAAKRPPKQQRPTRRRS